MLPSGVKKAQKDERRKAKAEQEAAAKQNKAPRKQKPSEKAMRELIAKLS